MGKRKTVLVVDDSTALLDTLTTAFEDVGYDVGRAVEGEGERQHGEEGEQEQLGSVHGRRR